ncbi:hypothetical protein F511_21889 [Dorcoceras hygrometricum]|uniref:Uncharacterized protein n=1 Tax=Dorcoceras hygrometricum TaxID=472368 RepID=A0A2Z7BWG7_9LAMI|nr:hypothetical protein F511_21889 [Dorcoceras hygrometricum]
MHDAATCDNGPPSHSSSLLRPPWSEPRQLDHPQIQPVPPDPNMAHDMSHNAHPDRVKGLPTPHVT